MVIQFLKKIIKKFIQKKIELLYLIQKNYMREQIQQIQKLDVF